MASVNDERVEQAWALMSRFAARTGLGVRPSPRRYLWTDAFAVCNFIGLARRTGDARAGALAAELVHRAHHVLGRHRPDDGRTGWISGLPEASGAEHPTLGGLRIGKPLRERGPAEAFDERLEWDRDGQCFHYLTRWMRALDQLARAAYESRLNVWARELAATAHRRFTHTLRAGARRMYWKMSIDLRRPLVPSMGHHDPLDGLLTCLELEETAAAWGRSGRGPDLAHARADFGAMIDPRSLATCEPLRIGGLLVDIQRVSRLLQLGARGVEPGLLHALLDALLAASTVGLTRYAGRFNLELPATLRIAFRELALAIGLAAVESIDRASVPGVSRAAWADLDRFLPLRERIERFWRAPAHREVASWLEHEDQNEVMLATSLVPDGYLVRPALAT